MKTLVLIGALGLTGLLLVAATATATAPAPAVRAPALADDEHPVIFEDRAKHLTFAPPPGWTFGEASDADRLIFEGPRSGGRPARVVLLAFEDVRATEEILFTSLVEELGLEVTDDELEALQIWDEAVADEGVALAVTVEHKLDRKPRLTGLVIRREHPRVLVMLCETAPRQFADLQQDFARWRQAVQL